MKLSHQIFSAFAVIFIFTNLSYAQLENQVWINEIHYDNNGTDQGEFIELVVQGSLSNISDITISLYNGSSSSLSVYDTKSFSDFSTGDSEGSATFYYIDFPSNGIQNGPDGISLDVAGQLVQFLSYEGTFTAANGPAQGVESTDIGVEQSSATSAGSSVSLSGTGSAYSDFQWINTESNSKGSVNQNQTIEAVASEIDEPTIQVFVDGVEVSNEGTIEFGPTLVGNTSELVLEIKNLGNDTLSISSISVGAGPFSISGIDGNNKLAFNEISQTNLSFSPIAAGEFLSDDGIEIISDAVNFGTFVLNLQGEAIDGSGSIPISQARTFPLGTRVTVSGRVTVANEFGGPLYMQDGTAGLAVFWTDLHDATAIGDSVTVTGPLNVFKGGVSGPDSDFLLQISERPDDDNITFQVHDGETRIPEPKIITINEMNSGAYESQLVVIQNAEIDASGVFQANTNYDLIDDTGDAQLRIDNNTNLVGASSPAEATNIIGVVGRFNGVNQLLPRFVEDLDAEVTVIPGEDVPLSQTFDIVTWNVEWFGNTGNGPEDEALQFENVKTLITTMDADIYALQEISDESVFNTLVDDLTDYDGIFAGFSQAQNTAYLYKTSTIQRRDSRLITTGMNQSDWANGRYPFYFKFNATINGEVRELHAFNIHAKAFGEQTDFTQRFNASNQMKTYLDNNHGEDNVIFLGDFNDEILMSTVGDNQSPYKNFDDDSEYNIVTKSLEEAGFTSFSSNSMIDHIVFSSELADEYFSETEQVENPFYIGSYLSTTSDHFPVWVRFQWGTPVSNELDHIDQPNGFVLQQNYPNPFNPSTSINYSISEGGEVLLSVFDVTGREVAILENSVYKAAGSYSVSFNASQLSSGIYFYRLRTSTGVLTKKMMLVK